MLGLKSPVGILKIHPTHTRAHPHIPTHNRAHPHTPMHYDLARAKIILGFFDYKLQNAN